MLTGQAEGSTTESSRAIPSVPKQAAMASNDTPNSVSAADVAPDVIPASRPVPGGQTKKAATLENATNTTEDGGIVAAAAPNGTAATRPKPPIQHDDTPELAAVDPKSPFYHEYPAPSPELNFTMARNNSFHPTGALPRPAEGNVSFTQPTRNSTDNSTTFEAEADENVKVPRHSAIDDSIKVPAGLMDDDEEALNPDLPTDTEENQPLIESAASSSDSFADKFGASENPATAERQQEDPGAEASSPSPEMAAPSPAVPTRTIIPYLPFLGQTSQVRENIASAQMLQCCSFDKASRAIHCTERPQ